MFEKMAKTTVLGAEYDKLFVYLCLMKKITILIPETAVMATIVGPRYMFTAVNQFLQAAGKTPLFEVELAGFSREIRLNDGLFSVFPEKILSEVRHTDHIIIPALSGDMQTAVDLNREAIPWLTAHYRSGAELSSLCVGAFLLAATGLLRGKQCSTHWSYAPEFRRLYPDVDLVDGNIITESEGIYSSGGANSFWNLLLYLVEKYTDRETAVLAAKYFVLDINLNNQAAFAVFQGQKEHHDEAVKQAQEHIERNFAKKITVEELADQVALGRRSFERRFKAATNNTVLEYLQRVKIEAAKRKLENGRRGVYEVMSDVGYADVKAFRDIFKKYTGLTPVEYRSKYGRLWQKS